MRVFGQQKYVRCQFSPMFFFLAWKLVINLMALQLVIFLSYYKFSELLLFFPCVAVQILIGKDGI